MTTIRRLDVIESVRTEAPDGAQPYIALRVRDQDGDRTEYHIPVKQTRYLQNALHGRLNRANAIAESRDIGYWDLLHLPPEDLV